jgi:porin
MKSFVIISAIAAVNVLPGSLMLTSKADSVRNAGVALAAGGIMPTTQPSDVYPNSRAIKGSAVADIGEDFVLDLAEVTGISGTELDPARRFGPTTRPDMPDAQKPPLSTPENVDTNKPPTSWQRATDDWSGIRPRLDDKGIVLQASLATDYSQNLRGGVNTNGGDFRHLFNANVTLDADRLFGHAGGTFFVNFQTQNGPDTSDAGDIQGYTNIAADGRTQLSELWYEQSALEGAFRVKVGKIDANSELAFAENAGEFLNSSMGVSPTILGLPTYPDPAFGVNVYVAPTEAVYVALGLFDGAAQEGIPTGSRGPKTLFGGPSDLFVIGEVGLKWDAGQRRDGRVGVGVWHHTGTFDRFDGGIKSGTDGFYIVVDQTLWCVHPDDDTDGRGIGAYLQYGHADQSVSEIRDHLGAGIAWTGMLPSRNDDVAGLGVSYVRLSDALEGEGEEVAVEFFYKVQVTPWISVKPDLQYIRHPGGESGVDDALVATVRAVIDF